MNNQNYYPEGSRSGGYIYEQDVAVVQRSLIQRVFLWMTMGLSITGLTAMLTYSSSLFYELMSNSILFWGLMLAELGIVFYLSSRVMKMSFMTATILFAAYSILNGVTLSLIFAAYTMQSIATTFFVTAGTFAAMAFVGYVTKRDLSKMGSILMMALIGLIIATVVNIFLKNSMFELVISGIGVLIFTGLTAYDTQKIKLMLHQAESEEVAKKLSVIGALTLYLDFINLFLYLLRFLGSRNE
ncbi:Bax inhibitor-1/YccA family protein [Porphyromonas sp. COT-290 OH860]|uniref:Bax inhibitor-1/YccA family protein n=1 Tax=Porphyromonas sp. COT-290 OH860 TaxID=1515615 RepID=UPI0005C4A391|nr:Bax inhibitor-1/YccA family protein [Porphyromonas sp. COT-290 OH860]